MSAGTGGTELPPGVAADLGRQAKDALGVDVLSWRPIVGGTNNRLFRVETAQGTSLLAKLYHRDRWNRQERDFGILTALHEHGLAGVPAALFSSEPLGYAVYAFEPGTAPVAAELTPTQMRRLAAFAAALHRIEPRGSVASLPPAISATFSIGQQLRHIEERFAAFAQAAADPDAPVPVRELATELAPLIDRAAEGVDAGERERELPVEARRLSSGDFGVHNLLVDAAGGITVLDWEWGGWDDPARLVMGFVAHAGSEGLSAAAAAAFLDGYAEQIRLSAAEIERFERAARLLDLEWAATIAGALAPEALTARRFAVAGFDIDAFVASIGEAVRRRLVRAGSGLAYRFPRDC